MNHRLPKTILTATLTLCALISGHAQDQGPATAGQPVVNLADVLPGLLMMRRDDVKRELKLTPTQQAKYKKSAAIMYEPSSKFTAARKRAEAKGVKNMLTRAQVTRLEQLYLQAQGTFALSNQGYAKRVGLSKVQQKKIYDVRVAGLAKFQEERRIEGKAYKPNPLTTKWIMDSIYDVLTKPQELIWARMVGKPFAFNPPLRPIK